jgi:hypothetical protein
MAAPSRMTRTMAGLLTRDLVNHHLAELARNGVVLPAELAFDSIDLASRPAARALLKVGMSTPAIQKALRDPAHPDHGMVQLYKNFAMYFAAEHPQLENGEPAPWSENYSIGMKARIVDGRPFDPSYEISPSEARTYAEYVGARGDLQAIRHDPAHPDHAAVSADFTKVMERAAAPPEPTSVDADQQPAEGKVNAQRPGAVADARQQINELLADKDFSKSYFSKSALGHAEAVEQMRQLHEALAGNAANDVTTAAPGGAGDAAVADLQARIATLNGQLRQFQLSAPDRAALADEAAFLSSQLPAGTRPAMPADRTTPTGRGLTERSVALTARLKTGGLRGQARADVLSELAAELGGGTAAATEGNQAA